MSDLLGYVIIYTVRTTQDETTTLDVSPEQLAEWFTDLGLNRAYLARSPKSVDAFRTATKVTGEPYVSDDGHRYQLTVDEVKNQNDLVQRMVLRRALDPGGVTIRVAELKYFRARRSHHGRIHGSEDVKTRIHTGLRGTDRKMVTEFVAGCMERYERGRRQLTPHKVRALLRSYLADLRGVPLTYGAFFVPADALNQIRALQVFVSRLGEASRMRLISLVNGDEEREMAQEAIDDEIDDRARRTLNQISQWQDANPGRAPGPRAVTAWYDECRHLQNLLVGYNEDFGMRFPTAADSLENLHGAIRRLTEPVRTSAMVPAPRQELTVRGQGGTGRGPLPVQAAAHCSPMSS